MFQTKNGNVYQLYNNINKDFFEWKNSSLALRTNSFDMLELPIDLQDVSLKGSTSSISKTEEIISKF